MEREDPFELRPGDVLGDRFRIERVLGMGGMGMVAAAWHLELRTRVALKVLLPRASMDHDAVERFAREASALSRLRSEYVVRVFDVGRLRDGGPPYMVMEHLEGEDLEARIAAQGPLGIGEAVGHVLHACEGIAEAHAFGIVHRDLKPANLFLTRRVDGSLIVKVVDFGIAKSLDAAAMPLTGPLVAMGSPQYMSPEQTRAARDVGASTDIWSLGVCLYEMLTGVPPFDGPSLAEVIATVLKSEPRSPEELREEIPPLLAAAVMRCLRKPTEERFADVAALAESLQPFAPASHAGAAERIRKVLSNRAVEPGDPAPSSRRLMSATEHPPDRGAAPAARRKAAPRWVWPGALGVVALGLVAAGWQALAMHRRGEAEAASTGTAASTASAASAAAAALSGGEEASSIAIVGGSGRPVSPSAPRTPSQRRLVAVDGKRGGGIARNFPESRAATPEPPPVPGPAASAPVAPLPAPSAPPPSPPRFVLAAAHVEMGAATNLSGTTAANVSRAIGGLGERMNACYRSALPQMSDPVAGTGTLHIETDEDGVVTVARVSGLGGPAACIAAAARGRRLPNVDTGPARADVPLLFKAQ